MLSDYAIHFKDMRRRDALQTGTILHFPIPVDELATLALSIYSYGGTTPTAPGGTADGSNAWYKP